MGEKRIFFDKAESPKSTRYLYAFSDQLMKGSL